jgi:hypothetical protein
MEPQTWSKLMIRRIWIQALLEPMIETVDEQDLCETEIVKIAEK